MDDITLLSWINTGKNVAAFLVAIGVAGEFAGDFISGPINRRVDAARIAQIAGAEARAVEAKLELAKFKAPREIGPDQRQLIISKCKSFPGTPFILLVDPSPEAVSFLAVIEDILVSSCAWKAQSDDVFGFAITTPRGYQARMQWGVSGITILFSPDKASDFGSPAKALADVLTAAGVIAKSEVNATADKKAIYILVGQKP